MRASLLLAVVLSLGVVSWAQEERRPVSEPQESRERGAAAQSAFATAPGRLSQENEAAVPRVVKFSGVLLDAAGKPLSGEVEVTFALYKQEADEEPLWTEAQRVEVDERGAYTALLGATQPTGMPAEVFRSDEARWLGVQVQGQSQGARTILVSVPYALKAVEAEKLSGKSLSDFVLSESLGDQVRRVMEGQALVASQATPTGTQQGQPKANSTSSPTTTSEAPMFPPSTFSGTNTTQIVSVQQNGSGNGLYAQTASTAGASGVVGIATSPSTSNFQNGVYGQNAGAGFGVAGIATNPSAGIGVYGQGANFAGVFGNSVVPSGSAAGVFGTTASPNGTGVTGSATATSGSPTGVFGVISSPNGAGVLGVATGTSGFANGVFGASSSPDAAGVSGVNNSATGGTAISGAANASSGTATGVFGVTSSPNGAGVLGVATGASGLANGVFGASSSPNGAGVSGVNNSATGGTAISGAANASSGTATGVFGVISSPNGAGVLGVANTTTGFNNGVFGSTFSNEGAGVSGAASSTSGNANGVVGASSGADGGIGVWGIQQATSGFGVGVRGDLENPNASGAAGLFLTLSPNSVAGQFANFSRQGLVLQGLSGPFDATQKEVFRVDSSGNLHITGNLTVDGTKSSTAKLQDGREVALYAVESPENWFEDFGSAELNNGVAWVPLDASFAQTVNAAVNYHVFLTATGDSNGLYVARKTAAGFEIREHGGGASNVAVDYRIVARRRGYEAIRMLQVPERKILETLRPPLKMATSLPKVIPPIVPAQAIRPAPPRPIVPQIPKVNIPQAPKANVAQPPQPR